MTEVQLMQDEGESSSGLRWWSPTGNHLGELIAKYEIPPTCFLSFLQEWGVISDNCTKPEEVVNGREACDFILSRWREFKEFCEEACDA